MTFTSNDRNTRASVLSMTAEHGQDSSSASGLPDFQKTQRQALVTLMETFKVFQEESGRLDLQIHMLQCFVFVAQKTIQGQEPSGIEVEKAAGLTTASSSRCLNLLGRGLPNKNTGQFERGLEWITYREDMTNLSRKLWHLTPKGYHVANKLIGVISKG